MRNRRLNYTISRVPIFLFLFITVFNIAVINLNLSDETYIPIFNICNEVFNTSVLFGLFVLLICFRLKLCYYNKVAALGMLSMNAVNLVFMLFPIGYVDYYYISLQACIIPISVLATILYIKKI